MSSNAKSQVYYKRAVEQFIGHEGETATLLSRGLFNSELRVIGFAPCHLNRWAPPFYDIGEIMAELKWDKTDFLECFGVLPETDEYETFFGYTVERQELVLLVTVRPLEGVVDLQLRRHHAAADVISFSLVVEGAIEYKRYKLANYLLFPSCRIVADRYYYMREDGAESEMQGTLIDVQLTVDPDLMIKIG